MNIVFLGCTKFSKRILDALIKSKFKPKLVFSIPETFSISYSPERVKNYNYFDMESYCTQLGINVISIDSGKGEKTQNFVKEIKSVKPDVILVMGWYYMVPRKVRELARYGAWGIHASLLPDYAGGAPLVWAIINGESRTGVTLFRLSDGVDDGDIIDQSSFDINFTDTIKDVYEKATRHSIKILIKNLKNIEYVNFFPQDKTKIKIYPQRKPADGEIDFEKGGIEIYNFIRAQVPPYPGAYFVTKDGYKIVIEKARIEKI